MQLVEGERSEAEDWPVEGEGGEAAGGRTMGRVISGCWR